MESARKPRSQANEGRVRVGVRLRPASEDELSANHVACVRCEPQQNAVQLEVADEGRSFRFEFDYVFDERSTQADVYQTVAEDIVADVLRGYNGTIMAYGQTGTGKTFTLAELTPQYEGIIPRAIDQVFRELGRVAGETSVTASLLQIYMESIEDLLMDGKTNLPIRETPDKGVYVEGLSVHPVQCAADVIALVEKGYMRRVVASTKMNDLSSRSHTALMLNVSRPGRTPETRLLGRLICVDLAGSERVKKSRSNGLRLDEAKSINLSLTALGNVIAALARQTASHIPYRDCKLTRLLQDSLGGSCKTSLIANIGPSNAYAFETLSSLQFAQRAMRVTTAPVVNAVVDYQALCMALQARIDELEQMTNERDFENTERVVLLEEKIEGQRLIIRNLEERNAALARQLDAARTTPVEPSGEREEGERETRSRWRRRAQDVLKECKGMDQALRLTLAEVTDQRTRMSFGMESVSMRDMPPVTLCDGSNF